MRHPDDRAAALPGDAPGRSPARFPPLGAIVDSSGVVFTVWAPAQRSVTLIIGDADEIGMDPLPGGYFVARIPRACPGQRYWYRLAQGLRPDPVSRYQPDGAFGPSMIVDPRKFAWTDLKWPGAAPRHRQVIYEAHIGTLTPGGTWAAAGARLPKLASLGVTTIEIMPVAEFDGRFGWGYDGVFLFAPYHRYGAPDDLRRFIDAAHAAGLGVILDVVYNHLGPSGNVLSDFSNAYFSDHTTEWGQGFNLDGDHSEDVRHFMRENVRHWLDEYHFDGLRFDATQALVDRSPTHIVHELTECGRTSAAPRRIYVSAESEPQDTSLVRRGDTGAGVDGLWNEDWHHSAFVALTGVREAYFTDYLGTAHEFASMARHNLLYQGQWYSWQNQRRGTNATRHPHAAFVCFLENHDQVANTGQGRRLHQLADRGKWRALSTLLLLGPSVPLLFQGQEEAVEEPFSYFADHQHPLSEIVRNGRVEFLSQFPSLAGPDARNRMPDPADEAAFGACRLHWRERPEGRQARDLYTCLLTLRRTDPLLSRLGTSDVAVDTSAPTSDVVLLRYSAAADSCLVLINLGPQTFLAMNDPLLACRPGHRWELVFCSEGPEYGGRGVAESFGEGCWRLQGHCAWFLRSVPHDRAMP